MAQGERATGHAGPADSGREGRGAAVIGVLGAGTMGAGIAQLACRAGAQALLHDPIPQALERGVQRVRDGLGKEAARRQATAGDADGLGDKAAETAFERLQPVQELSQLLFSRNVRRLAAR